MHNFLTIGLTKKGNLNNAEVESRNSKKIGAKTILNIQHYIQLIYILFLINFSSS